MTGRSAPPRLDTPTLRALKDSARLPHPDQILDDFVLWMGSHSRWPGDMVDVDLQRHRTLLGAVDRPAFDYMIDCIEQSGFFRGIPARSVDNPSRYLDCSLTPFGWGRFRELLASRSASGYGFMAMKYDDEQVDAVVREHFVPQVKLAGFDLRRVGDRQPARLGRHQLRG